MASGLPPSSSSSSAAAALTVPSSSSAPLSSLLAAKKKTNHTKLSRLLIGVGRCVLQDVFDAIYPPSGLNAVLCSGLVYSTLNNLKSRRILNTQQWKQLFPGPGGSASSANFDVTLLFLLLRNICSLAPPATGWDRPPSPSDLSRLADLVRIKLCRNELYAHTLDLTLSDTAFETNWNDIKEALIRLGGSKYEAEIEQLKVDSIDAESENTFNVLLQAWEEGEEKILDAIRRLDVAVKGTGTSSEEIKVKGLVKIATIGGVVLPWAAGSAFILHRYSEDPEMMLELVEKAIIPYGVLALAGAIVVAIVPGSFVIKIRVSSLEALDQLWESFKTGEMAGRLETVIVTDDLKALAPDDVENITIDISISGDDYEKARDSFMTADLKTSMKRAPITVDVENLPTSSHQNLPRTFIEDLEEMVTCHICQKILTEPKTLPCLHTFCITCIQSWNQTCQRERKPLTCPSCRSPIKVDVGNLPTSFHHNSMIQMYNNYKLKSLNEAKLLIRNEREHLNEVLEKCNTELQLSDESRKSFDNQIYLAQKEVRRNALLEIKILHDHVEAMITRLNDIHTTNKAENDEEKSQFNETIKRILNLTNQCQQLEDMNVEQFQSEEFQQLLSVCNTTVKEASNLYKKPLKRYPSVHYIPNQVAIKSMQDLGKVVQSMIDPSRCSIESISQARCGFSNHFNIVTRDTEGDVCYTNKGSIDVQIQDIDGKDVHTELVESQTGKYIVKYKAQKPSPYRVVVSIGGKSISNSPQNVETIDAKAEIKPVRFFETTRAPKPRALAVSDTGEVAIVNNGIRKRKQCRIVLFSADGEYLREFGGEGTGESRLSEPFGVAFNDDRLLVSDYQDGYGCIKEFDINGNYNRTIHQQEGMKLIKLCKTCTEQSIACLTTDKDFKSPFIKFFSKQTGDLLQDIKLDISVDWFPKGLAYNNNKYFVSFLNNSSIHVFNENGGLLYTLRGKDNKEDQLNDSCGLAVFGANMLLVCYGSNDRLQLLSQDGEFIRSFGSFGLGLGEMKGPVDVVVTPDGQVFVLEQLGKRVQVFR